MRIYCCVFVLAFFVASLEAGPPRKMTGGMVPKFPSKAGVNAGKGIFVPKGFRLEISLPGPSGPDPSMSPSYPFDYKMNWNKDTNQHLGIFGFDPGNRLRQAEFDIANLKKQFAGLPKPNAPAPDAPEIHNLTPPEPPKEGIIKSPQQMAGEMDLVLAQKLYANYGQTGRSTVFGNKGGGKFGNHSTFFSYPQTPPKGYVWRTDNHGISKPWFTLGPSN